MNLRQYEPFSKEEFETTLKSISGYGEFPTEWYKSEWTKDINDTYRSVPRREFISEYCYIVPLTFNPTRILKIYSSVQKGISISREVGDDAIRVVLADNYGEPKHEAFTRINRTRNWQWNLKLRISEAIEYLGFDTTCPKCGKILFLIRNARNNSRFLGCSSFPDCDGKRKFDV